MRLTRTLGMAGALILAALVGGTLIGATLATDDPTTGADDTTAVDGYCDTFMDALASELGVSRDELIAAGRNAATAAIDEAAASGDLDADDADAVRQRIADADGDGCAWFGRGPGFVHGFGHGFGRGEVRGFLGGDVLGAAAEALGMESSELIGELGDAGSLQSLAEAQGVNYDEVKSAVLTAVQADLDAAVAESLTQERADEVIERLSAWLDEGGELGGRPGLGMRLDVHGEGGPFGPFAPWHSDDESNEPDGEDSGT